MGVKLKAMIEVNKIYCESNLDTMSRMADKSIDLVLTDPPYNAKNIGPNERTYSLGQMQLPLKDYKKFCKQWFKEAQRVGKRMLFTPGIANVCFYPQPDWIICWHKPAAVSFNRMGGYNAWEPICFYGKMPKGKRIGQDYHKVNTLNLAKGPESEHPCPKPIQLIRWAVIHFSLEGETVYDPFMGSGTTAVACIKEGRNYIGSEINPDYVEIINKRISIIKTQKEIFAA